jgi:hypothetical protein
VYLIKRFWTSLARRVLIVPEAFEVLSAVVNMTPKRPTGATKSQSWQTRPTLAFPAAKRIPAKHQSIFTTHTPNRSEPHAASLSKHAVPFIGVLLSSDVCTVLIIRHIIIKSISRYNLNYSIFSACISSLHALDCALIFVEVMSAYYFWHPCFLALSITFGTQLTTRVVSMHMEDPTCSCQSK